MEEKWNCFPADGMLSRGLLLACVDHVKCRMKFLHQLGILWNLPPFDRVSRWKGATVCFCTVPFSFTLNGFEFGAGGLLLCFQWHEDRCYFTGLLEAFSHPAVLL